MAGRRPPRGDLDIPERMRNAADELFDLVYGRIKDALDNERVYTAQCPSPKCRGTLKVKYPDVRGATDAMRLLLDYGFGKPGQQQAPKDPSGLAGKAATDLDPAERALLLERLRDRLKEGNDGEGEDAPGLQGGAEEDPG